MKKVYITALQKLIKKKTKNVNDLSYERRSNATYTFTAEEEKQENIIKPERTFESYTDEINGLNKQIVGLKKILRNVNEDTRFEFEGEELSISDAIFQLGIYKSECNQLSSFKNRRPRDRSSYQGEISYTVPNFDIELLNKEILRLEDLTTSLQVEIDRQNLMNEVEIPEALL